MGAVWVTTQSYTPQTENFYSLHKNHVSSILGYNRETYISKVLFSLRYNTYLTILYEIYRAINLR